LETGMVLGPLSMPKYRASAAKLRMS
jgi:hypothetical protein